LFKSAAKSLSLEKRRAFQAEVAEKFCKGSPRKAETMFGWGREAVKTGLQEQEADASSGHRVSASGRRRSEDRLTGLMEDIQVLIEPTVQTDPKFQTTLLYTRMTADAVSAGLVENGYSQEDLPSPRTIRRILNRNGFRLRRIQKVKPIKKVPQTNAIFEHLEQAHQHSSTDEQCLRISIDSKAKVNIGAFSRRGKSRRRSKALDHDMNPEAKLVPFGILEVDAGQLNITFGTSRETSDFIVDSLQQWWDDRKTHYLNIRRLQIDLDNGPSISSHRTQFIKRMVEFADHNQLTIELVYYPPYHSKYNPIERCWGILEAHWNGALLDSVSKAINWAATMTWKGIRPIVGTLDKVYQTGKRLTKKEMRSWEAHLLRDEIVPRWGLTIAPPGSS